MCSAWPQLAAVDSPTVEQAGYYAYLIVHPAELTATAPAPAAAAAAAVAQPVAAKYGVPQHRPPGCDAPWALPLPPLSPVRANSAAAPAAVAMPLHRGHSGASGAVHAGVGVQSPVMTMLPPLHAQLLRQLTPEAFRLQGTATAAAAADSSKNIDALHRVARRHSSSSSDNVESASSRSSDKQYSSSTAQKQQQQQQRQGSKRSRSPPALQRRESSSSSSSSATSSSYRHRTSYGDEISYKSFAADVQCDDSRRQHISHSSGSDVSSSYKHAAHKNDSREEKRARYDSSKQASSSSRHSHSRSRSSSRERSIGCDRRSKHFDQSLERSGSRSTSSSRSDSRGEREATRQRSSSVTEQRYVAVQPLTAQSSADAYNARKQARAAAVAAAKAGSSSKAAAAAVAAAAVAAVEPSVVSPAASPTLLPAAHTDLCAELNSNAVAVLPPVSLPMQPVRMFVGTSVLPQCESKVTAAHNSCQAATAAAPTATVDAALVQPSTCSNSSAQLHDGAAESSDPADAFAEGCAQVSANGPVQCPPSWSYASTSPKGSTSTGTASTQLCATTKQP
eukprot:21223-Heterococcus_DN1.PRE.3